MKYIRYFLFLLFKTNLFRTLWINFKMLPWRQACKLPIYIYGRISFRDMTGKIILAADTIHSGMVKIGKNDYYVATSAQKSIWTVAGTLIFHGSARFMQGSYLMVAKNGTLEIGNGNVLLGSNMRIFCFHHIVIGDYTEMTWDIQIMDTSFHYIEQTGSDKPASCLTRPVVIGKYVWVGNRSTISKDTVLPDYAIVASNSLVNKDFSAHKNGCLIAGIPAEVKKEGVRRVFGRQQEQALDKQYGYSRNHL